MALLTPILMYPAYRYGEQTPWGGSALREIYKKGIPDERTGESLEVSCIPGLNSTSVDEITLTQFIEAYGERLMGTEVTGEFPLLLKLLDARDKLSVQVHPDDDYARRVENKMGKTEAWVILAAKEGAQLVYGVNAGVTREQLRRASQQGEGVEKLLRMVDVHPGDVFYIPAGTIHAIGAGIVLYEIQQSSDVTYRFYDWNRTDAQGRKRALHIDKAVDVADVNAQMNAVQPKEIGNGRYLLLHEKYFSLERWDNCACSLPADKRVFRILTALKPTRLAWKNGDLSLKKGQTALLPADGYDLAVETGGLMLAWPTVD